MMVIITSLAKKIILQNEPEPSWMDYRMDDAGEEGKEMQERKLRGKRHKERRCLLYTSSDEYTAWHYNKHYDWL